MSTYFISDLHLGPHTPTQAESFYRWLPTLAADAKALYILGDFFDAWIGDDEDHPAAEQICTVLKQFAELVPTYLIRGNRDFLIGKGFTERTNITVLEDCHKLDLYGTPTLLMHGDTLCTEDHEYMQFRSMVRNPAWQHQVLSLPLEQRRQMAADLRNKSQSLNAMKASDIMDVTPSEVVKIMEENQVQQLIHGHTHRPKTHAVETSLGVCKRIVLGDWHESGWYIRANNNGVELVEFSLS